MKENVPLVRRRAEIAGGIMLFPLAVIPQQVAQPKSSVHLFEAIHKIRIICRVTVATFVGLKHKEVYPARFKVPEYKKSSPYLSAVSEGRSTMLPSLMYACGPSLS